MCVPDAGSHSELVELQLVLEKAGGFFDEARADASAGRGGMDRGGSSSMGMGMGMGSSSGFDDLEGGNTQELPLLSSGMGASSSAGGAGYGEPGGMSDPKAVRLGFITGMLLTSKTAAFERVLFRATRGNMFLRTCPIEGKVEDPATGEKADKTVYVVFFAGERARAKILKICETFAANRYPFPEDFSRQRQMNAEVTARLQELHSTLEASVRHRDTTLSNIGHQLEQWLTLVRREKAVYHTLNMLSIDVTRKCLVAEGWCPVSGKAQMQEALFRANRASSAQVGTIFQPLATRDMPPTYFKTNKITVVFQGIVEAYGVGRYREVNPTPFTIVTFPFLFAVMFGDFGHGILMLLAALYLVLNEKKLGAKPLNEIIQMGFDGRYCILLMSVFSIYTVRAPTKPGQLIGHDKG